MAEEENKEEIASEGASKEKASSKMLMIIIIVVLVLIIIGGSVVALLLMGDDDEAMVQRSASRANEKSITKPRKSSGDYSNSRKLSDIGILYPVDTFTVNLKSDAGRRYLKVTLSLELQGEELSLELDSKAPVLRDRIIRILTSKSLEEISSKKGKQKVSDQIMDTLNAMVSDGTIQGIYFTEFVIQ
ncbi:flagellar basal body-associated protein FliL [Sulfurimonas sp.]|uniref:flagellar basal body-associated protein FliL n=1 Tax=Sulfurimonas sp. TaxID=2022749 RepID=UPI002B47CE06|nr:flagellar basal body-associated protein FliL [Sulfurimonas sp.]